MTFLTSSPLPSSSLSSSPLTSPLCLKHTEHTPYPSSLHWWFPLPGMLTPRYLQGSPLPPSCLGSNVNVSVRPVLTTLFKMASPPHSLFPVPGACPPFCKAVCVFHVLIIVRPLH